jgi:hypothetical protein
MNRVKTFILAGQSNMVGMGEISELAVELRRAPRNVAVAEYKTRSRFAKAFLQR